MDGLRAVGLEYAGREDDGERVGRHAVVVAVLRHANQVEHQALQQVPVQARDGPEDVQDDVDLVVWVLKGLG